MMVGHAALAFAIAGSISYYYFEIEAENAIVYGMLSAGFASAPDFDMGYAFIGLVETGFTDLHTLQNAFWDYSNEVHRGMTHSLIVGLVAGVGFGTISSKRRMIQIFGFLILITMVSVVFVFAGILELAVIVSFIFVGSIVSIIAKKLDVSSGIVTALALVGLLSHPFGDLFTGTSPDIFYPIDIHVLPDLILLSADPTLHLLAAFMLEILVIWSAIIVYIRINEKRIWNYIHKRSIIGVVYCASVFVIEPPTLSVSYHFVFTVLSMGIIGILADPIIPSHSKESIRAVSITGLATITLGLASYSIAYVLL